MQYNINHPICHTCNKLVRVFSKTISTEREREKQKSCTLNFFVCNIFLYFFTSSGFSCSLKSLTALLYFLCIKIASDFYISVRYFGIFFIPFAIPMFIDSIGEGQKVLSLGVNTVVVNHDGGVYTL